MDNITTLKRSAEEIAAETEPETKVQKVCVQDADVREPESETKADNDVTTPKQSEEIVKSNDNHMRKGSTKGNFKGKGKASRHSGHISSQWQAGKGQQVTDEIIRSQVEYYLSDQNVARDNFFRTAIEKSENGWISSENIMNCPKFMHMMTEANAGWEKVVETLKISTEVEVGNPGLNCDEFTHVRRVGNKALPSYSVKGDGKGTQSMFNNQMPFETQMKTLACSQDLKKELFRGGAVLRLTYLTEATEEEIEQVKPVMIKRSMNMVLKALKEEKGFSNKVNVIFVTSKKKEDKSQPGFPIEKEEEGKEYETVYYVSIQTFMNDLIWARDGEFKSLKVEYSSEDPSDDKDSALNTKSMELKADLIYEEKAFENVIVRILTAQCRGDRLKSTRNYQQWKKNCLKLKIGERTFSGLSDLKKSVTTIMASKENKELLKKESRDYKLIETLLSYHPRGTEKMNNMEGLHVNESQQGGNRCFYVVKNDGTVEDFSMMKIYSMIESKPELMFSK